MHIKRPNAEVWVLITYNLCVDNQRISSDVSANHSAEAAFRHFKSSFSKLSVGLSLLASVDVGMYGGILIPEPELDRLKGIIEHSLAE